MSDKPARPLTHRVAGRAQVGLSYFFLAGFFAALGAEGLGYIKMDIMGQLGPMAMLVLSFWFQRQRETTDAVTNVSDHSNPTQPPQAAKESQT
jgi:hypothetical protein